MQTPKAQPASRDCQKRGTSSPSLLHNVCRKQRTTRRSPNGLLGLAEVLASQDGQSGYPSGFSKKSNLDNASQGPRE